MFINKTTLRTNAVTSVAKKPDSLKKGLLVNVQNNFKTNVHECSVIRKKIQFSSIK